MGRRLAAALLLAALGGGSSACREDAREEVILATTTSLQDAGLLDVLLPPFERSTGIRVKVIAVGTGAALEMARRGDADVVIAHAPELEREYAAAGHLVEGRTILRNDFVIAGPPGDPAHAGDAPTLEAALLRIATAARFVSRGDGSGTEIRERELWTLAGVDPDTLRSRIETGQGQGATLFVASERGAYLLTDGATLTALGDRLSLESVRSNDPRFRNEYHAHLVNPDRHPIPERAARALIAHLASDEAQRVIGSFGRARFGRPLFVPAR
ncbi:MAG TPA: substrate-binding domain-containing protein [Gemmatimonadales bacterium]